MREDPWPLIGLGQATGPVSGEAEARGRGEEEGMAEEICLSFGSVAGPQKEGGGARALLLEIELARSGSGGEELREWVDRGRGGWLVWWQNRAGEGGAGWLGMDPDEDAAAVG